MCVVIKCGPFVTNGIPKCTKRYFADVSVVHKKLQNKEIKAVARADLGIYVKCSPKQFDICNSYNPASLQFLFFCAFLLAAVIAHQQQQHIFVPIYLIRANVLPPVRSACLLNGLLWGGPIYAPRAKLNQHCKMHTTVTKRNEKRKQQQKFITFVYACQMTTVASRRHSDKETNTHTE